MFWRMVGGVRFMITDGLPSRIGRISLAGEVSDAEPYVPKPYRVLPDRWVLSVISGGHGSYVAADGRSEPIDAGTVLVIPPGTPHWYGTEPGRRWTEFFTVFSGPLFDTLAATGVLPDRIVYRPTPRPRPAALTAILGSAPRSAREAELQIMGLGRWLVDALPSPDVPAPTEAIAAAVDLLDADQQGRLSMPEVARRVGLDYDAFRRRFTAEIGQSPLHYRNHRRLQTAAGLLQMTNMTLGAIAHTLGFADEFHLSRRFRQTYGVPPTEYRGRG